MHFDILLIIQSVIFDKFINCTNARINVHMMTYHFKEGGCIMETYKYIS